MYNDLCLGIDFGTTNSCLCVWHNNKSIIIKDIDGSNIIPTVINISNNKKTIGKHAFALDTIMNGESLLVYEVKKLLGKKYSDLTEQYLMFLSYDIQKDDDDNIVIYDSEKSKYYLPEEIATHLFMSFKLRAEIFLSEKFGEDITISNAVISVPAYFNKCQREIIKQCAENSGLIIKRLINEPTAAALCYGTGKNNKDSINVIVFDFGGGTLDVSLLNIYDNSFEVLGCSGNSNLGGSDYDERIMEYCITEFVAKHDLNIELFQQNISETNLQKLKQLAEQCKIALTDNLIAKIIIENFYNDLKLNITITRDKFNEICNSLNQLIIIPLNNAIINSEIEKSEIDEIIMVGGMTRVPIVRYLVEQFFNKDVNCSIDPDNVVAIGCAIQGHIITNKKAMDDTLLLIDRTSLSIGVETHNSIMDSIIPRGTIIPVIKKKRYTTDTDNMESIHIKIYEGERKYTKDNFFIGDFVLVGIEKEKRGIPKIEITFEVDIDGIIKVKAEDLDNSLNKKSIQINQKKKLTDEQIQNIIENAKMMDEIDRLDCAKKKSYLSLIDTSNRIIENINSKSIKIDNEEKEEITKNVQHVLNLLKETSYEKIDIDKYKELLKNYKYNYGIYIIQSTEPISEFKSNEEIDDNPIKSDGVEIYDSDLNNKKYDEQVQYIRQILEEYELIKKQVYTNNNDELLNDIDKILDYTNDIIIQIFIDRNLNDDKVNEYITNLYNMDIAFKEKFNTNLYNNDAINILSKKIKEKENILLDKLDKCSENNENILQKLYLIMDFEGYVYKIRNKYIEYNYEKIIEITEILDKLNVNELFSKEKTC